MLRIAIQTKGRLNEQSIELLHELGIDVDAAKRKFLSKAANFPIEVLYLRDDDIPQVVANGTAALGIVGLNEVAERGCDVDVVTKLGFGGCRISLAIPKADEYNGVEYFEGKRIATSYPEILEKYLREQGVTADVRLLDEWSTLLLFASSDEAVDMSAVAAAADCNYIVVLDERANGLADEDVVWLASANTEPTRDIKLYGDTLVVDARAKRPGAEGAPARWPNVVTSDEQTVALVDGRWAEYGLGEFIPSPSLRYMKLLLSDKAEW